MSAWAPDDYRDDRLEAYGQSVGDNAFPECSFEELCASIDAAVADSERLAGELADLLDWAA